MTKVRSQSEHERPRAHRSPLPLTMASFTHFTNIENSRGQNEQHVLVPQNLESPSAVSQKTDSDLVLLLSTDALSGNITPTFTPQSTRPPTSPGWRGARLGLWGDMVAYQFRVFVLEALTGRHWCKRAECAGIEFPLFPTFVLRPKRGGGCAGGNWVLMVRTQGLRVYR